MNDYYQKEAQASLDMFERGELKENILSYLTNAASKAAGTGAVCSILLLDNEGLLRNGASPGLPADYLKAIDRLKPHPRVGTCAAAAATGNIVITPDFMADDKWSELRHLPIALGFKGAWSMPIKSKNGSVLGTFGTYLPVKRHPYEYEIKGVELLADVAGKILES